MTNAKTVLEPSTNTHVTNSDVVVEKSFESMGTMQLAPRGSMIVEHGHHHTVATEADTVQVIKIVQQEFNPILKEFQNTAD